MLTFLVDKLRWTSSFEFSQKVMSMRIIFKLLDVIFILLGLPYLFYWVLHFIQPSSSTGQNGLFFLAYLSIAFSNYRDKWNNEEKKGLLTYPLLVALIIYNFFLMKIALIGGVLALLFIFFKRLSTIFISGSLLTLWSLTYIQSGSLSSLWKTSMIQDSLSGWMIIFPLLGGWIYWKVFGRFYPKTLKDVQKKSSKRFRLKKLKLKLLPNPIRLVKKGISLIPKRISAKHHMIESKPVEQITYEEESVPVQKVASLIQEMTTEKGLRWTYAATEALYNGLKNLNVKWKEDRFHLWAKGFVEVLTFHHDSYTVNVKMVHKTLEKFNR
jgi:hypothetical protein